MHSTKKNMDQGIVFNIQKFSLHDGPGIRTTAFLKGCPLKCKWCSNPESQAPDPQILVHPVRCIECQKCIEVCTTQSLRFAGSKVAGIDRKTCKRCFKCVEACPSNALELTGRVVPASEVITEVLRDKDFYINSGGGVTFSGGEPMFQPEFLLELLRQAKQEGLHTAVETCGYAKWTWFEKMLEFIDLLLFDVKHLDTKLHLEGTGVKNEIILANLKKAAVSNKTKIWIRIPVIPGFNDSKYDINDFKRLLQAIFPEKVSLLPYHTWGISKYNQLNRQYNLPDMEPLDADKIKWIKDEIEDIGLDVDIGS